jgi:hypothetical protein
MKSRIELELISEDKVKLIKSCKEFKARLDGEITPYDKEIYDSYRMKDYASADGKFKAIFLIQNSSFEVSNDDYSKEEKLPHYAQTIIHQTLIFTKDTTFLVTGGADSFASIGANLRLNKSLVYFERHGNQDAVVVEGKDVACDLLNGKGQLESSVTTNLELKEDAKRSLNEFYLDQVLPSVNYVFLNKATEENIVKAVLLGFKLGKVLEERSSNIDEERITAQLQVLFSKLFTSKLENSGNILDSDDGKRKEIQLPLSVESITKTILKMQVIK